MKHALLAARVFGRPLLIASSKLDAILAVLGPRLGLDCPMPTGPVVDPKERQAAAVEGQVGVLQVVGTLAHRVDALDAMSGMSSYETIAEELERLASNPAVSGILLEVDSFGGEAAGCFDLADRIRAAREKKPVYGVASQYAMSAGYALLSQCDRVFVPQTGEVGSIGVVTTHVDRTAEAAQKGVRVTHVYAGKRKVDHSPFVGLSEDAKARLGEEVGQLYDQFLGVVEAGRGTDRLDADGARATEALTFIGQKAVDAGLADEVGDKAAAMTALQAEVGRRKHVKELEAKVVALTAENGQLKARIETFEKAEKARLEAEDKAYLEQLAARSAEAQVPIDAAKIAKVKAHLDAGRREIAHELGDELLASALERAGGKAVRTTKAAPPAENTHQKSVVAGQARLLRRDGYRVKVSEDGTQILEAIAPSNGKKG